MLMISDISVLLYLCLQPLHRHLLPQKNALEHHTHTHTYSVDFDFYCCMRLFHRIEGGKYSAIKINFDVYIYKNRIVGEMTIKRAISKRTFIIRWAFNLC